MALLVTLGERGWSLHGTSWVRGILGFMREMTRGREKVREREKERQRHRQIERQTERLRERESLLFRLHLRLSVPRASKY